MQHLRSKIVLLEPLVARLGRLCVTPSQVNAWIPPRVWACHKWLFYVCTQADRTPPVSKCFVGSVEEETRTVQKCSPVQIRNVWGWLVSTRPGTVETQHVEPV
jgi:hypothetical protein